MAQQNRATLKEYFNTGDQPTESQLIDLIDSLKNLVDDGEKYIQYTTVGGDISHYHITYTSGNVLVKVKNRYGVVITDAGTLAQIGSYLNGNPIPSTIIEVCQYGFLTYTEFKTIITNYTLLESDLGKVLLVTGIVTITMPGGFLVGWNCTATSKDSNTKNLTAASGQTLEGDGAMLETEGTSCLLQVESNTVWSAEGRLT